VPRWRREPRRLARAPIVIGVGVLAALVLALVTRPAAPARPATYARAEQLREEKHVPTHDPVSPERWRSSWQPRAAASAAPRSQLVSVSSNVEALAGVVGLCLLASLALGSVALVVERRGRRDSTGDRGTDNPAHRDFFLRLGYAGAGACFGVAISVAIVLATTRLRPDGSIPGAVTPQPSRANAADTLGPAPRSQSLGGRDQSDVAVPAMAVRRTEPPLPSARRAGEGPRDVPVNRARPASPGPAPASVPAGPVAASSIGEAPSEPEVSASPAFTVPALPTTETPGAEMPRVQTLDVETASAETAKAETTKAETQRADTAKVELPKAEVPKTEAPRAEMPKGYMPKVGTPKIEAPKRETARVDPATLQKPQAQTSDRPRAASSSPDQNLIDKIRDDWTTVKGQAKSDVDGIVRTLRHWLRRD
jgi:hypothetical protein